jgi:peptide/nickel transport system permease protein
MTRQSDPVDKGFSPGGPARFGTVPADRVIALFRGVPYLIERSRGFWSQYRKNKTALVGLVIVMTTIFLALFAPLVAPHGPFTLQARSLQPPGLAHPLGTDQVGRDVLSYVIYGTRVSMAFGLGVATISLVIGVLLGAIPGYFGGVIDDLFSRFFEIFLMIPQFVLIVTVVALFGNNIIYTMFVVGFTLWPSNAKITRAQVLTLKRRTFVRAALASGASHVRILARHILPNGLYPVIANSTLQMAYAILFEASLSFLGLGDPNYPSWGQLLAAANLHRSAWWLSLFSGLAILILVLGFNLVGDGIQTALNPRQRERQQ